MNHKLLCLGLTTLLAAACGGSVADHDASVGDRDAARASSDDGGPTNDGGPHASGVLPVDCTSSAAADSDPHCQRPSSLGTMSVGTGGARVAGMAGLPSITSGFVDHQRLVLSVTTSGAGATSFVMAVDLATGNRTLLSGSYMDPSTGLVSAGAGPAFHELWALADGGDGHWYAIGQIPEDEGPPSPYQLFAIDPTTGNRTLEYSWGFTDPVPDTFQGAPVLPCMLGGMPVLPERNTLAFGTGGTAFVALGDPMSGRGIFALGATCQPVTYSGPLGADVGSGASIDQGSWQSLQFHGGQLWGLLDLSASLFRIDPTTGMRTRVSSADDNNPVGSGDAPIGTAWLAFDASGTAWTAGASASTPPITLTSVDVTSGARTAHDFPSGPLAHATEQFPLVFPHPSNPRLLLVTVEGAVVLYDTATGDSNILSY